MTCREDCLYCNQNARADAAAARKLADEGLAGEPTTEAGRRLAEAIASLEPLTPVAATRYPRLGPFSNEDGDIWVPAEVGGIVAARRKANEAAMSTFAFQRMEFATMSLHEVGSPRCDGEGGDDCEFKDDQPCTWTGRAYHFLETGE